MWTKLALPVGLGIVAAILNWMTIVSKTTPESYVVLLQNIDRGKPIPKEAMGRLSLPRGIGSLSTTLVRWEDAAIYYGRPTPRTLKKGDVLFCQDIDPERKKLPLKPGERALLVSLSGIPTVGQLIQPGQFVDFVVSPGIAKAHGKQASPEFLGPFRVVSVGENFGPSNDDERARRGNQQIISVAVKQDADGNVTEPPSLRLMATQGSSSAEHVTGILLRPDDDLPAADDAEGDESEEPVSGREPARPSAR